MIMYLHETLGCDFSARDKYGYSCLDYAITYKKLYCFIYIYYKCGARRISKELLMTIIPMLCQKDAAASDNPTAPDYAK